MIQFLKKLWTGKQEDFRTLLQNGAVIVDVRTADEYRQGHIKGSRNLPLNEIRIKSNLIKKWGKPVITVCRSGNRSQVAHNLLQSMQIESYNGGSWKAFQEKYQS